LLRFAKPCSSYSSCSRRLLEADEEDEEDVEEDNQSDNEDERDEDHERVAVTSL
jgi:hypothetical protein